MTLILRLLLLSLGLSLGFVGSANAQTTCLSLNQPALMVLFSDNAGPSSITPENIRSIICSMMGGSAATATPNWTMGDVPKFGNSGLTGNTTGPYLIDSGTSLTPPTQFKDSKNTAIIFDGFAVGGFSQDANAQSIFNQAVSSGSPSLFQSYDGLRGVAIAPPSSTVNTITGVAGYTVNNTVPIGQRSQTVALFGIGVCVVNNSDCWGVDTIVSDNPSINNTGVSTGTGKFLFNEFDLNITSPNTSGANLQVGGTAFPTNMVLNINAIGVNKLWGAGGPGTGTAIYANGLIFADACCANAVLIGINALSGSAVPSMPLLFNYRDSVGHVQNIGFTAFGPTTAGQGEVIVGGTAGSTLAALTGLEAGGGGAFMLPGDIAMAKGSNSATAPGGGFFKLEVVAGTAGGTCKLIAFGGTSSTPVTIVDNVGAGC